jgi:16S rRNA (guanine966-N2)-methyltransferase
MTGNEILLPFLALFRCNRGRGGRPITDRVKQSLFDILSPLIDGAAVYDCFAGTGSMGLECLSRGAISATFFEADRSALRRLRQNIETLKVHNRSHIVLGDLFAWFAGESKQPSRPVNLIFLDPPYRFLLDQPDALKRLAKQIAQHHLAPTGTLIFRHAAENQLELDRQLTRYDQREYGGMTLEFLKHSNDSTARE